MSKKVDFVEADPRSDPDVDPDGQTDSEIEKIDDDDGRQFNKFDLLSIDENADDQSEIDEGAPINEETSSGNEGDDAKEKRNKTSKHSHQTTSNKKRKPHKRRGKKNTKKNDKDSRDLLDEEELDNLSKAIVLHSSATASRDLCEKYKLLKVDMRNLIPESELKRMFGKSVIKDDRSNRRPHPGSNLQRSRFVSSGYFEVKSSASFSAPRMELDEAINDSRRSESNHKLTGQNKTKFQDNNSTSINLFGSDEPIYFRFVHDKQYQEAQKMFLQAVNQGNPEIIVQNLTVAPYHAESLIQLSHMVRVSEDYKTASEFIERALIIFERGFHPRFNVATATCRLSYKRPENRTFFITIFKHINYCHRRGLRRTPFEYCKLLLSLEPENDPLLAVQMLDFFAIRSDEFDYLIDFYSRWSTSQKLPNMSFSLALAYFLKSRNNKQSREENEKYLLLADRHLQSALILFPNFIIPLLDACSAEPDSELKKCNYFDYSVYSDKYKQVSETVDVLVNLYVKRTYSLWKQKNVMSWLERNVASMVEKFRVGELTDEGRHFEHWHRFPHVVPKNLLRHIALCDLDIKIPSSASSSTFLDIDPYPPTDSLVSYDISQSSGSANPDASSFMGGMSGLFLRSFLPSFSLVDQQQPAPTNRQNIPPAQARQRSENSARNQTANRNSQITMEDYVLDEQSNGDHDRQLNELQSTISDLANTVTNLLNMQPLIRAHQERLREATNQSDRINDNDQNDDRNNGDGDARRDL